MTLFDSGPRELLPYDGSARLFDWVLGSVDSTAVMNTLVSEVEWETHTIRMFGKEYLQPRLVAWFGDAGSEYSYSGLKMNVRDWVEPVNSLKSIVEEHAGTTFNSVLVNYYRDGRDKVGWHRDDEPELGSEPTIASLSIGATRRFKFSHLASREVVSVELPTGSLVVMSGLSQACWEHEVPRQLNVKEARLNLTFRKVRTRES